MFMNTIEIYKFAGAILAAALLIQAVRIVGDHLVPEPAEAPPVAAAREPAEQVAEMPAEPETVAEEAAEMPAEPEPGAPVAEQTAGVGALLAAADPKAGKAATKKCFACHSFDKGAPHKIGPALWGVVGADKASRPGYAYSDGFAAKGGAWTYAELDVFLTDPKAFVSGTKMIFPGIKEPEARANVIAFLRTLSDEPEPLP
jgi:cytochrome c